MTQNDRSLRVLLVAIVVLLAGNLVVNMNNGGSPRAAYGAGIPDSGAQLQSIVDATQDLGRKVDHLTTFLESGKMQVVVQGDKSGK